MFEFCMQVNISPTCHNQGCFQEIINHTIFLLIEHDQGCAKKGKAFYSWPP